tara:strand:+ start:2320 stop:2559 length:240 start_codon:yes stop_codon:yes gene_type:complete
LPKSYPEQNVQLTLKPSDPISRYRFIGIIATLALFWFIFHLFFILVWGVYLFEYFGYLYLPAGIVFYVLVVASLVRLRP